MSDGRERWRLVLGEAGEVPLGGPALDGDALAADDALAWLYDRALPGPGGKGAAPSTELAGRAGSRARARLSVPEWLGEVHRLFPRETVERIERDAVERYGVDEVLTDPEVLARVTPSPALLRAVLRTRHLMSPAVLALARRLVARVVDELAAKLARRTRTAFSAPSDRRRPSSLRTARNFDPRRTVRRNLAHWDRVRRRIAIERPLFSSRVRRHTTPWQVILLVDQSGSMAGSVVHAAVTAACLHGLPSLRTHLVSFDTQVVDLTAHVEDPVELLLRVQLGGGTDIARAVEYAASLVAAPHKAVVVVVSDFFEGGDAAALVRRVKALVAQGTRVLGLAALDEEAAPAYDRDLARALVDAGADVAAMTPGALVDWLAEKMRMDTR